ncbi:hypothetical protein QJS04_geneDACA008512 [Acorus gramineus]|uniref:Uncharacterized protein n=1 Tax=Acorus gramineus TaxID=55184 RepID=A0AAV9AG96_ACOGR|nr:hypothetical protein QJS04_geneDACA008512 [Acorus gramineus]
MADEGEGETTAVAVGWKERVEDRWRKMREHAEAYPYVWASYALVYGGFAFYGTWRWRKLRRTEDRVRALHRRLKQLHEEEEAAAKAAAPSKKGSNGPDAPPGGEGR